METNTYLSNNARIDAELILQARSGIQNAFSQLLKRYKDAINFMLLKMVGNETEAEDLTIEAFEKAFSSLEQYDPKFPFSSWLFSIASNNAIDFLRKKKIIAVSLDLSVVNEKHALTENPLNRTPDTDNPEDDYVNKQIYCILREAVSALKPRYRTVLEMRYFEEYTYSEISQKLNLPLGTVKVQLFRSREMLFDLLKDTEIGRRFQNYSIQLNN